MEFGRLLIGLVLTCLPACAWLVRLIPPGTPGRFSLVTGYGVLSGFILISVIMRGLSAFGVPFSLLSIGLPAALVLLSGLLLPASWRTRAAGGGLAVRHWAAPGRWQLLIIYLCAALVLSRLATLGLELWLRPIFAWDGKQHWARQARVFYETGSIAHYVPLQEWLALAGSNVYTTTHANYPITVPLLQAWTSTVIGHWHESRINLPWLLCYIALGLVFFGQALAAGARTAVAAAATYMLLSLPYLNTQVALAGYADLFMATFYLSAAAAFCNWASTRSHWQATLAVFFALSCALLKHEGIFWLLSFVPGLALALLGLKRGLLALAGLALAGILMLWLIPANFTAAGQSLAGFDLRYRPETWPAIFQGFFTQDNWHLLMYLLVGFGLATVLQARTALQAMLPFTAVIVSAACLFLALYLLTRYSAGALLFTSINRVALQLMPAVAFLALAFYLLLSRDIPAQRPDRDRRRHTVAG